MSEEPIELGRFGFGIRIIRNQDGKIEYQTQSANWGVPIEIVIMQMKAFLNKLENEYFDNFDKNSSQFDENEK